MIQRIQRFLKKRRNKKGQCVFELALGFIMISALMFGIFDLSLVIRAKTETATMARNGVRYLIMQGIDVTNPSHNEALAKKTEQTIQGLFELNHPEASYGKGFIRKGRVTVQNTRDPKPIMTRSTGANAVYVQVCEVVFPVGNTFSKGGIEICSEYTGFHSGQFKKK